MLRYDPCQILLQRPVDPAAVETLIEMGCRLLSRSVLCAEEDDLHKTMVLAFAKSALTEIKQNVAKSLTRLTQRS